MCSPVAHDLIGEFNVFHPEVFDTFIISTNIQSNTTIIWYVQLNIVANYW